MLTKRQLREIHGGELPLHVLELDYVESVILKGIYSGTDILAFKGGTCLRKAQGLNRFSEDLDFSLTVKWAADDDVRAALEHGTDSMGRTGMTARLKEWNERSNGYLGRLQYEGPLFTGENITRRSIEIEISKNVPLKNPVWTTIITEYPDTGTFSVNCLDPAEMLLEKLRCLEQRRKPRDLYDLWFLLKKGSVVNYDDLGPKFEEVGLDPPRSARDVVRRYDVRPDEWERDLRPLIRQIPDLTTIREDLEGMLE